MKGRALRRALQTNDIGRIGGSVPLIVDTTELITPEIAYEMLLKNKANRPINWKKVEEYASAMARGEWRLHAQGIILDADGNLLTGQKRLWAVIYSGVSVYMRVSRGNPIETARLIDRGAPQSARDLASRTTGKKHSPLEVSVGRAILALEGQLRPSVDALADVIQARSSRISALLSKTVGIKKSRAVLMLLAAICVEANNDDEALVLTRSINDMIEKLNCALHPQSLDGCWNRGPLFSLALEKSRLIVREVQNEVRMPVPK